MLAIFTELISFALLIYTFLYSFVIFQENYGLNISRKHVEQSDFILWQGVSGQLERWLQSPEAARTVSSFTSDGLCLGKHHPLLTKAVSSTLSTLRTK